MVASEVDDRCVGTGSWDSGSGLSGSEDLACTSAAAVGFAAAITSPDPSARTFTFGPICITVIEIDLPLLENSIIAMLGWLMTEGCSFQPAGLSDAR
ncbi:hypothetical protein ABIG07_002881 [Bradyrhizobium ottawaense]|uniref:Uncharacterized protein n=1 Tax=Bradyrhizobium ottawaense TaxID=931866 RepID=A0ABV4FSN5_9BRAD